MTETDLIALYCFVDDFFQNFQHTDGFKILFQKWQGKRGPHCRLSISEVVTLNLVRFFLHIQDVKHFHKLVVSTYAALFPAMPNYENFLKATNKSCGFVLALLRYLIYLNQIQNHGLPHFVDSTPLPVCENRYIGFTSGRESDCNSRKVNERMVLWIQTAWGMFPYGNT